MLYFETIIKPNLPQIELNHHSGRLVSNMKQTCLKLESNNMTREDFKIEIIEEKYRDGTSTFVPNIYQKNEKFTNLTKLGRFYNNLYSRYSYNRITEYDKLIVQTLTEPMMNVEEVLHECNIAIAKYIKLNSPSDILETIIHKY